MLQQTQMQETQHNFKMASDLKLSKNPALRVPYLMNNNNQVRQNNSDFFNNSV